MLFFLYRVSWKCLPGKYLCTIPQLKTSQLFSAALQHSLTKKFGSCHSERGMNKSCESYSNNLSCRSWAPFLLSLFWLLIGPYDDLFLLLFLSLLLSFALDWGPRSCFLCSDSVSEAEWVEWAVVPPLQLWLDQNLLCYTIRTAPSWLNPPFFPLLGMLLLSFSAWEVPIVRSDQIKYYLLYNVKFPRSS